MSRTTTPSRAPARSKAAGARRSPKHAAAPILAPAPAAPAAPEPAAATKLASTGRAPRAGSKLALIVAQLSKTDGATIAELGSAMGWQPHTVRAALSGLKQRGYVVVREVRSDGAGYRMATPSTPVAQEEVAS